MLQLPDSPDGRHPDERQTVELLDRIRGGEEAAWGDLYRLHHDDLLFMIRRQLGPRLRAVLQSEDIFQSVAFEAFRDLPNFDYRGQGSLRAFLHKLVLHKIRDRADYFAAKKRGGQALPLDEERAGAIASDQEPRFFDSERYDRLEKSLAALPEEMRRVIELRRFEGYTSREAAEQMGKSEVAVRKLYSRALARLSLLAGEASS